jgi:hypothetical protein
MTDEERQLAEWETDGGYVPDKPFDERDESDGWWTEDDQGNWHRVPAAPELVKVLKASLRRE